MRCGILKSRYVFWERNAAFRGVCSDVVRRIAIKGAAWRFWAATRHATSQQRLRGLHLAGCTVCARRGGGRGNLRVAKTPPLQSALAGRSLRGMPHRPSFAPMGGSTGMANGRITTRRCKNRRIPIDGRLEVHITTQHAASLRPPRNGRIGFKPPYSKRDRGERPGRGSIGGGDFPFLRVKRFQSRD